ncbi:D-alanyl-D-alanine carboxypeptidase [Paenibacillus alginolyticus]|uniref:serine-type D-Ala-D-Ala carboxypeptidase n=1 Tax=Paenibacillus alginolyticus TaxID=59839 RepID=A0ABT4GQ07_9BACL|nr:D-alanyl-D-alanine carboxypeptidase family protein [Paenibacillus alginolyticus]MCY9670116.1 D-alanyl-D-alanine carboxypeptidase [Paenibacillus alginolyticus]MCY9698306.1 D-alanyl-D-alanine carboxypeptidase [Paenibacillus alginolyticus]MEC0146691.1 D-alanyl-D-alanine carboxypeptidase [Paenibacillus alginolyticus]
MKKALFIIVILAAVLGQVGIAYGETNTPTIHSGTGVVIDSSTGEVLFQKNKDEQAFPASLTKLMTAILLEDHVADGAWMTASKKATQQEASNFVFNMKIGEKMQKEEALRALLVISANDVAMMIAEHIGGDEAAFAAMMNTRAASIGMTHTHFVTPNGLHDPQHYTTTYDLALLAKEAMKYPAIMEAMGTEKTEVKTDQRSVVIKDRSLIFQNPIALGGKTGFTNQAGNTLIEYMKKDNKTVIAVVMKSSRGNEYQDVQTIGNYGLEHLDVQMMFQKGDSAGETTFYGENVQGVLGNSYVLTKRKDDGAVYTYSPIFTPWQSGQKTIIAGEVIGDYQIKKNGKLLSQIPIVSAKEVVHAEPSPINKEKSESSKSSSYWPFWVAAVIVLFALGIYLNFSRREKAASDQGAGA